MKFDIDTLLAISKTDEATLVTVRDSEGSEHELSFALGIEDRLTAGLLAGPTTYIGETMKRSAFQAQKVVVGTDMQDQFVLEFELAPNVAIHIAVSGSVAADLVRKLLDPRWKVRPTATN
jgi:hypothetical protein